jgi:hypothetical protein
MEAHLGRNLKRYGFNHKDNEVVHHINGVRDDNRLENLQLMTTSEHISLHSKNSTYVNGKRVEGGDENE